jgi:hypothetical protein
MYTAGCLLTGVSFVLWIPAFAGMTESALQDVKKLFPRDLSQRSWGQEGYTKERVHSLFAKRPVVFVQLPKSCQYMMFTANSSKISPAGWKARSVELTFVYK